MVKEVLISYRSIDLVMKDKVPPAYLTSFFVFFTGKTCLRSGYLRLLFKYLSILFSTLYKKRDSSHDTKPLVSSQES